MRHSPRWCCACLAARSSRRLSDPPYLHTCTDVNIGVMGTSPNDATGAPGTLEYFIPDMDCAACARTVKGAVSRCEGTGAVQVLFSSQTLRFTLDETRGSRAVI